MMQTRWFHQWSGRLMIALAAGVGLSSTGCGPPSADPGDNRTPDITNPPTDAEIPAAADSVLGALGALGPAFEHALPAQLAHHRLESDAFATLDPEGPGDLALAHRARAILDEGANLFPGRKRLGAGFGGRGRPVF